MPTSSPSHPLEAQRFATQMQGSPRRTRGLRVAAAGAALVLAATASACSSGSSNSGAKGSNDSATTSAAAANTTTTALVRPSGPGANLSKELTGGEGRWLAEPVAADLKAHDYVEHEYEATGTATAYTSKEAFPLDGRFKLEQSSASAPYATRIVVRRPAKAADFNGTVVVEWLNVSGGLDADPDWVYGSEELLRKGYAWVGVSAQQIGVEGGDVAVSVPGTGDLAGQGLRKHDPVRYGDLHHPGDAFSYDIFTQVGRGLRASGPQGPLGDLTPKRLMAAGESQSAFMLTTYANGVQPLTREFDGFLIHSRGGAAAPLGEVGKGIGIAETLNLAKAKIRTDLKVPVLILESESDVVSILDYKAAEQPDTDRIRVWEMAGTAHADAHLLGPVVGLLDCGAPVNSGPHHFIQKAAIAALNTWMTNGTTPAKAPRLQTDADATAYVRDDLGIVKGGIRTPEVDVPTQVLSSQPGPTSSAICLLTGSTQPMTARQLAARYPDPTSYSAEYAKATDAAIKAGFVLSEDRAAMIADSHPNLIVTK